jgi:hypothetical protein
MSTDVVLDQGDGTYLELQGRVVRSTASDFMIDAPDRRQGTKPFRRALVHDQGDGLSVNYAGDYDGGVTVFGVAQLFPKQSPLTGFGTLVVRGGISYEVQTTDLHGHGSTETVSLDEELGKLNAQIAALSARVAALEAHH